MIEIGKQNKISFVLFWDTTNCHRSAWITTTGYESSLTPWIAEMTDEWPWKKYEYVMMIKNTIKSGATPWDATETYRLHKNMTWNPYCREITQPAGYVRVLKHSKLSSAYTLEGTSITNNVQRSIHWKIRLDGCGKRMYPENSLILLTLSQKIPNLLFLAL